FPLRIRATRGLAYRTDAVDPFVHRVIRIKPLGVLLVPVEDERRTNEAFAYELEHVTDRGRVAEGQADLRLQVLRARELVCAPDVLVVGADRLLDQHVLPGLESREGQLLVAVAPPATPHIDHVDVAPV